MRNVFIVWPGHKLAQIASVKMRFAALLKEWERAEAEARPARLRTGKLRKSGANQRTVPLGPNCNLQRPHFPGFICAHARTPQGSLLQNKSVNDELLTINELAARVKYSAQWVRHQVKYHGMPCVRFNQRAWRFHWPTVLAWLNDR